MRPGRLLLPSLAAAALAGLSLELALGQQASRAPAEPELAATDDVALLGAVVREAQAGDERALLDLTSLLDRTARGRPVANDRNAPGDALVELANEHGTSSRLRPLGALALEAAQRLPRGLREKLAGSHEAAFGAERSRGSDDDEYLLRRYPLAPASAKQAERLAARAFEAGDDMGAASLDRLADRLVRARTAQSPLASTSVLVRRAVALIRAHDLEGAEEVSRRLAGGPNLPPAPGAIQDAVRRRLSLAWQHRREREGRDAPGKGAPEVMAVIPFSSSTEPPSQDGPAPVPAVEGDTVFASDGSRVLVIDAREGSLEGRLPQDDDGVAPPAMSGSPVVSAFGGIVLAPLFFESFLLPSRAAAIEHQGRLSAEELDPQVRGGFVSLFAFDAAERRLAWWDGDVGPSAHAADDVPRGRPAGAGSTDATAWQRLARGHVAGRPLQDGRRVYVPLVTSAGESQVWVAAYERATGESQPLALVPAWRTFLTSSLQANAAATQPASAAALPAVNPRLALDPSGRVIVQTDLGVVAALDARTGALEWLVRLGEGDSRHGHRGETTTPFASSIDPPVVVPGRAGKPGLVVVTSVDDQRWIALSCEDGSLAWRLPFLKFLRNDGRETPRLAAVAPDVLLGSGGPELVLIDAVTGSLLVAPGSPSTNDLHADEAPAGPIALAGPDAFVVPLGGGWARVARFKVARDPATGAPLEKGGSVSLEPAFKLPEVAGAAHLTVLDGRLVATTHQGVVVYSWRRL